MFPSCLCCLLFWFPSAAQKYAHSDDYKVKCVCVSVFVCVGCLLSGDCWDELYMDRWTNGQSQQLAIMMKDFLSLEVVRTHCDYYRRKWQPDGANVTGLAHTEQHKEHLMISLDRRKGNAQAS